jgi:signal transduction histidine kinase/ActR/RegA family two-component response regulator
MVPRPGTGSFLLTAVGAPGSAGWLLWVEDEQRPGWTDAEAGALMLAGQNLTRWLAAPPAPRWAEQLDRAARQQRLESAAQVARRLAHDYGNVLTGILGFSELALSQQIPVNTPLHCYLTEVHRGAQAGAQLTNQLRLFARRQGSLSRSCTLAPVLAQEEERLRAGAGAGARVQIDIPDGLPPTAIDPDLLRQALAVLLDNAREATPGPGAVHVSARPAVLTEGDCREFFGDARPGPHVEITVTDSGTGLSPEAERRLFTEPFYSTKPRHRGLGLATAYGILYAQRGGLRLERRPEGGVVARVVVPAVPDDASPLAPPGTVSPARGERVLVVDDDPMILQLVCATLERAGYRVQAVSNAEDALRCYAAAAPDPFRLVLADVIMPRVTGIELARRLLSRDADVRVLFMSGQVTGEFASHDFAGPNFELLPKPFRPEGLLRAVRNALDRPPVRRPRPGPADGESKVSSAR